MGAIYHIDNALEQLHQAFSLHHPDSKTSEHIGEAVSCLSEAKLSLNTFSIHRAVMATHDIRRAICEDDAVVAPTITLKDALISTIDLYQRERKVFGFWQRVGIWLLRKG